jgi:acetyltransferase-like isoleucine patch superfamily enzyme
MKKKIGIYFEIVLGIIKSIYLNFRYLPISQAIKLPILVSRYCKLLECKGSLKINSDKIFTGMILLGIGNVGIFDKRECRGLLELSEKSNIIFEGKARLGNGFKLSSSGKVIFGENFTLTANSTIYCSNEIIFGNDVLVSWETLIMDSDIHKIFHDGSQTNISVPINIGNHVWIGCRCTLLKGITIADGNIIGANTIINKSTLKKNKVIVGNPARVIDKNVEWER